MITIYTDPYSGVEILQISQDDVVVGICYDPRKTLAPVPWSSSCPHCRAGRQKDLSIHTKRAIKMLLSGKSAKRRRGGSTRSVAVYSLPTNASSIALSHEIVGKKHVFRARKDGRVLVFRGAPGSKLSHEGDLRAFQSPILHRCVRLLFSARPARPLEVAASFLPIVRQPKIPRKPGGRRLACRDIDWPTFLTPQAIGRSP
jgi:hypothetical protein